jgi:hypothetical protein
MARRFPSEARAASDPDIDWRIAAMRPQITAEGAIPLLLARPGANIGPTSCCSCGDRLRPDDHFRCQPCAKASIAVVAEVEGLRA